MQQEPITVYFDGLCPVCSREVALYRRIAQVDRIVWRDLAGAGDVLAGESFALDAALRLLHVRDAAGVLHTGLDAHLVMWQRLPVLRWLAGALRRSAPVRRVFEGAYLAFTWLRPGLRRRQTGAHHA